MVVVAVVTTMIVIVAAVCCKCVLSLLLLCVVSVVVVSVRARVYVRLLLSGVGMSGADELHLQVLQLGLKLKP